MCAQSESTSGESEPLAPRHPPREPLRALVLPEGLEPEHVIALDRIIGILTGREKDRRIADLIEANNALIERARVAEEAVRSGSHREIYAQLDRLTALADPDITGRGEARIAGTIARLRARVAELEEKLKAVSCQLSARGAP